MSLRKINFDVFPVLRMSHSQAFIAKKVLARYDENIFKSRKISDIYHKKLKV